MTKDFPPKDFDDYENSLLFPPIGEESRLLIRCRKTDYCASTMSRAIEDCGAAVMNLNVTSLPSGAEGELIVAARVNVIGADSITRSLSRYGYEVVDAKHPANEDTERMRLRAAELLRYLEM